MSNFPRGGEIYVNYMHTFSPKIEEDHNVIFGHEMRQTQDIGFLCIHDIYQKLHRPNFYDIGGTYITDIPHYWFICKTEKHNNIFLLHIFVINHNKGSFNIALSNSGTLSRAIGDQYFLSHHIKGHIFENVPEKSNTYITTYNFSDTDVDLLKNKRLYIYIGFPLSLKHDIGVQNDFNDWLQNPFEPDFTIESDDGQSFKVHKKMLALYSDYFKAMFNENTIESQNNFVKLVGVNRDDVKSILEFIYTGTIKKVERCNFFNLLLLADSYNIKGLFQLMENTIALCLNKDNIIDLLILADMANSEFLKITAFKFIKRNASSLDVNVCSELKNPSLIKELCVFMCTPQ